MGSIGNTQLYNKQYNNYSLLYQDNKMIGVTQANEE